MLREPGCASRPKPGPWPIARRCEPPDVADVVGDETTGAVMHARRFPAWLTKRLEIVEQRLMQLCEIGHLGRQIVHLKIDVEVVVAVPRREHAVVPQALQIRRQAAGPAARNQQIAAELKI